MPIVDVIITAKALKELERINEPDRAKLVAAIEGMKHGLGDVKKLANHDPAYRLRVGRWRVLFDLESNIATVRQISLRKDAYR